MRMVKEFLSPCKLDEAILDRKSGRAQSVVVLVGIFGVTTDIKYGFMSLSKIGLVKITCHESLHSSHDVEFLHSYQQSYTSTWDKL